MSVANWGLLTFIFAVAADTAGLLLDGTLWLLGWPTVTSRVVAEPWLGVPILLLQLAAFVGLYLHFYRRGRGKRGGGVAEKT